MLKGNREGNYQSGGEMNQDSQEDIGISQPISTMHCQEASFSAQTRGSMRGHLVQSHLTTLAARSEQAI